MKNAHQRASDLLTHYMRGVHEAAGLKWDSDNTTEMVLLVDAIADVAAETAAAVVEQHRVNEPHIHADGSTA